MLLQIRNTAKVSFTLVGIGGYYVYVVSKFKQRLKDS